VIAFNRRVRHARDRTPRTRSPSATVLFPMGPLTRDEALQ
jgi:hypothetical protein